MRIRPRFRNTMLFLALAGLAVSVPTLIVGPSAPSADAAVGSMTWHDEFDLASGSAVDRTKWNFDIGGGGFGNNERQYYTDSTRNVVHDGKGNLVITARRENPNNLQCHYGRCEYTSARMLTRGKFMQKYGRFETRMKLPRGQGIWPAFWMMGEDPARWPENGEIDIMENIGREPNMVYGTLHGPGYSGGDAISSSRPLPGGGAYADAFHTFTIDWEPNAVTWYVDGQQYARKTPADIRGNKWVYDQPFFMLLNLAVGGNWPGMPDATTQMPQELVVDYVRVYAYTEGGGGGGMRTGQITGMNGKCIGPAGGKTDDSTPIDVYSCVGDGTQQWTIATDGTIRNSGKCLDVRGAGTSDGTAVQLYTCNGSAAQKWVYSSGRDLVNPQANKCLEMKGNTSADFTQLQIWTCTGAANQKWAIPA